MKRPIFLTILLVLMTIAFITILLVTLLNSASLKEIYTPVWTYYLVLSLIAVDFIGVILLWMWKKVGFYIILSVSVISVLLSFFVFGKLGIGDVVGPLLIIGILYLAMRPVWNQFK